MNEFQNKYPNRLHIISVHWDNDRVSYAKLAERMNGKFEGTTVWHVEDLKKTMNIYGVDGWPYFFLLDEKGRIVDKWSGARKNKLRRMIRRWVK